MKFRTGLLLGLAVGYGLARRSALTQDDPYVVKGPQREQASGTNTAARAVGDRAQRLADQATVASLDVIRRTRSAIQSRLGEASGDDAAWN